MSLFKLDPPKDWKPVADPTTDAIGYGGEAQKYVREYRKYVKASIITAMAPPSGTDVLEHNEFVILYSGPSGVVYDVILEAGRKRSSVKNHNPRSYEMALEFGATRINDTTAGITLNGIDLDPYFEKVFQPLFPGTDDKSQENYKKALDAAYAEVWGGISELFADLDFKTAATAVCGAGPDRVFVKDELPVLVENKNLKTINGIDMDAVRDMFKEVSPYEAFRLVCLSELNMSIKKAQASGNPPTEGWTDFFERHYFFSIEQRKTKGITPLTDAQKARKQAIIKDRGLQYLYDKPTDTWSEPHRPPAELTYASKKTGLKPRP